MRRLLATLALSVALLAAAPVAAALADGNSSNPNYLVAHQGLVWFNAYDPGDGYSLWKSDGTANGTVLVYSEVDPSYLTWAGSQLFFEGADPGHGQELWVSKNGSVDDTQLVSMRRRARPTPTYPRSPR